MNLVADDGIAHVIEVRDVGVVKQQRVFELAGIANHAVVADEDMFAHVGVMPDLAVAADDGGALDHRAVLDKRALANEHLLTDKGNALTVVPQLGAEVGLKVNSDLL